MVKKLELKDHEAVKHALLDAEKMTRAELAVVVARASDEYRAVALTCGLMLGTFAALLLWWQKVLLPLPWLLCVQLGVAMLWAEIPVLRHLSLCLAPAHLLRHRAAEKAAAEYVRLSHHHPASAPLVLLYVSLAERYVHIYSSRTVREKIPDSEWNAVVKTLTVAVGEHGIGQAVAKAIQHAVEMLKEKFPKVS